MFFNKNSHSSTKSSVAKRRKPSLAIETLEKRDLMSAFISLNSSSGVLTICGDSLNDTAIASQAYGELKATLTNAVTQAVETYPASSVTRIVFLGMAGNDEFTNGTAKPAQALGGSGDDHLVGGAAAELFCGEDGNDTVVGNGGDDSLIGGAGKDTIYGGDGKDTLKGGAGNDLMYGGAGNDLMYAGAGNDVLFGEAGNDVIVSIGGGTDVIWGGSQWDNVWMDTTDFMNDTSANESSLHYIHKVGNFTKYSYTGGSAAIPVSKELNGQALLDPLARDPQDGDPKPVLHSFDSKPLFAANGPTEDDIFQGSTGDCFFMARLSAIAKTSPEYIRKMVVDLGDGTYAVRFYRNGQAQYVRVDGDLYVNPDTDKLEYAKLGQQDSIWVPIVEKAYAFWRKKMGSYDSISGGGGGFQHVSKDLGLNQATREQSQPVTAQLVMNWVAAGRPNGAIQGIINTEVTSFLNWIATELAAGKAVVVGAKSGLSNDTPLQVDNPATTADESTWRRGQHIITVDHVLTDSSGHPIGLVYRNPYGTQGPNGDGYVTVTDFARIYFCIGGAGAAKA